MMIQANYAVIILSAVICMVLGFGWYGPLFGKVWGRIVGMRPASEMTPEENAAFRKKTLPLYILQFALSLLTMYVLFFFVKGWKDASGITSAFWIWLGFVMPMIAASAIWSGKPQKQAWQMFFIMSGYQLLTFLIAGALIGGWM